MHSWRSVFGVLSILIFSILVAACGGDDDDSSGSQASKGGSGGDVDVLGIWGSDELTKFESMVAPWQKDSGRKVNFTGTRDITAVLTSRVEGGNPPDVAIPAEVGLFKKFATEGKLTPLSKCSGLEEMVKDQYPKDFIDLATVNGTLYGFFMKADTKATVWYNPKTFKDKGVEPLTDQSKFSDLMTLSQKLRDSGITPWSMGVEAGAASGWPGGDWIQQILLNEGGPQVYSGVVDGSIKFTDPRVKDAWQKFGQVVQTQGFVLGGPTQINATNFKDSVYPPFTSPPRTAMAYLGGFASGFIKDQFPSLKAGTDYDFFPFPGGGVTGGANIVYAFNADDTTCSLMKDLASADAQKIWVKEGGFTSVNKNVSLDTYPDDASRKQAKQLLDAGVFRLDLDDAIGGATQQAMFAAVTQYITDPSKLDSLLANLDAIRAGQGGGR